MISVLCSDRSHPVWPHLEAWTKANKAELVSSSADLSGGRILFLVSCGEIIGSETRARYRSTRVLHASDLPQKRGWHPHIWSVLEGEPGFVVSMIEAAEPVDTGLIWRQQYVSLEGHELYDEINAKLFSAELEMMTRSLTDLEPDRPQCDHYGTSYRKKRTPEDSRLDPERSIAEQFDLLRVCDPDRFPAFLDYRGQRFTVTLRKQ